MKLSTAVFLVAALSLVASAPAQTRRVRKTPRIAQSKTIVRLTQTGEREITAHFGDVLAFDMTYDQSGSTGYRWQGPGIEGKVFGKAKEVFVKDPKFKESDKPVAGAPEHRGTTTSYIKCVKKGKGTLTYVFSRNPVDGERADGDKVCKYTVTVQ